MSECMYMCVWKSDREREKEREIKSVPEAGRVEERSRGGWNLGTLIVDIVNLVICVVHCMTKNQSKNFATKYLT